MLEIVELLGANGRLRDVNDNKEDHSSMAWRSKAFVHMKNIDTVPCECVGNQQKCMRMAAVPSMTIGEF